MAAGSRARSAGCSASTLKQLSEQWQRRVQSTYLPEIASRQRARDVASRDAHRERVPKARCTWPRPSRRTASQVAYFSEKNFYFVDLYLADGETGKVKHRLLKSILQQQLRDLPLHQLRGDLVAGRQVPRGRRQARPPRRHRDRRCGQEPRGATYPAQAERRHHPDRGAPTASSWSSPATTAASPTCSSSTPTAATCVA